MDQCSAFIGLDVHRDTIAVAVAAPGRGEPHFQGTIRNEAKAIRKLVKKWAPNGEVLNFCYEAGPCGYGLYRELIKMGHDCWVVAPSKIPSKPGDRVKTDRKDALQLARLHRAGELEAVWVPDEATEAMRDLVRARSDLKATEKQAKQRLAAFLLRQGKEYPGPGRKWTQRFFRWLETVTFETAAQQIVLQEYLEAIHDAQSRVAALEKEIERAWPTWSLAPVVQAVMAMRGIRMINAVTLLAELGDLTRFDSPQQLMGYLGAVPREYSTGTTQRRGPITKSGNAHARKMLTEAAWAFQYPARKSPTIQRRAEQAPPVAQAIAWKAQKRLHHRFRHLTHRGKPRQVVITAVARELVGFLWAIAQEVPISPQPG